ncbi:hypothetical protein ZIOFF_074966 [Zingiber officinale]|uniref:Malic enzyme NAD-binding domain-containing protein n=1 Tax=Zingiber officinale TaxID=94328 RepID=A0A8J5EL79_ZINOF|nr:hypothetical protein ZIOFF_074966 [Zingiber officinale]
MALEMSKQVIKPTILLGHLEWEKLSRRNTTTFNEKSIILALSSRTSQSECNAEEAYSWRKGQAIFASGSTFDPIEYDGKVLVPRQV